MSSSSDSAEDVLFQRAIVLSRETAAIEASSRSSVLCDGQDIIWHIIMLIVVILITLYIPSPIIKYPRRCCEEVTTTDKTARDI